ncbi:MAG TPA: diacylglycerol kinase family protein [Terriglobales bacterium]|nr:diacylglycerol kinase family protein [Terriglobales bacterium]
MHKATILFNPNSGRRGRKRDTELDHAIGIIQSAGVRTELTVCRSSHEATDHARCAVAAGSDTVFACGGDGTIHDVIQGLAGTPVALAILPFGTANALAHDLGIPLRPGAAAQIAVNGKVRRIPLGRIEYEDFNGKSAARYFTVAAGIGVDAHLFYKLTADLKNRSGMTAYYLKAWQLWATHRMRKFEVEYANGSGLRERALLTELLAVRIRFFGNILRELVPGASLDCRDLRTVMCRTASRNAYLRYVAGALLGRQWNINGIDLVSCSEISCKLPEKSAGHGHDSPSHDGHSHKDDRVYVEADGELLGRLPARMTMAHDALSLVVPA